MRPAGNHDRFFLFILTILILFSYSNSYNCSWQVDDISNIVQNPNIQISELSSENLLSATKHHYRQDTISRPVAKLSFALNWYLGGSIVRGYHVVNVLLHILTSILLYKFILLLLQFKHETFAGNEKLIAFLAVLLWSLNPIQTQTVTYITQRMNLLSALFSLSSMYLFAKAIVEQNLNKRIFLYSCVILSFLLAMGAKENAITLPLSILLLYYTFFNSSQKDQHIVEKGKHNRYFLVAFSVIVLGIIAFLVPPGFFDFSAWYAGRSFTLFERILSECRILFFYISLLFFPSAQRLSFEHDVVLSTSFFEPITTILSITAIISLVFFSIYYNKNFRFLSFAILFFFLNHIVESTIIPLELIFEHRNYLPSFFIFLPLSIFFVHLATKTYKNNKSYRLVFLGLIAIICTFFVVNTLERNRAWKTSQSLALDSIAKAPGQSRPYHILAVNLLKTYGDVDQSIQFMELALTKEFSKKVDDKYLLMSQLAHNYITYKKDYDSAFPYLRQCVELFPHKLTPRIELTKAYIATGKYKEALSNIQVLLQLRPEGHVLAKNQQISRTHLLNLQALTLLRQGEYEQALEITKTIQTNEPHNPEALATHGIALSAQGRFIEAENSFEKQIATEKNPRLISFFLLLENSIKAGNTTAAESIVKRMLTTYTYQNVYDLLDVLTGPHAQSPVTVDLLRDYLDK